jgi:PAS domain S-box-containing protein
LSDAEGQIYCAVNPIHGERHIADQPYFQNVLQTLDISLGVYEPAPITGRPTLNIAYPVLSFDGNMQIVIVATLQVRWLTTWQNELILPANTTITLFTPQGAILQRWVDGVPLSEIPVDWDESTWFASLQSGRPVLESHDLDGTRRLNTLVPLESDGQVAGYLHLGYPVQELYTQAYQALWWKLGVLGASFLGVMLLARWGSERFFLYPLNQLIDAVNRLQFGDLEARASAVGGLSELDRLARSFDSMADALQQREDARQQAIHDLEASQARFKAAFDSSAIGIGILSLDGDILAANAAVCKMSGYTEDELIQRNDRQNVYPEDLDVGLYQFAEMIAGKRDSYSVEKRYMRKNGEVFWTRLTLSLVRDGLGKPAYLVGMIEDIDKQKQTLAGLQESEARFRAVFENTAVGVALMTLDRRIVQINPTVSYITGYSAEEIIAINPSELTIKEDRYIDRELFLELVEGRRDQYLIEKRYIRKDGSTFWGRINFALVRNAGQKPHYIVGIMEDITEEKNAAERLVAQEAEYRRMLEQRIAERTAELNQANELLREKAAQDAVFAERTRLARDLHDAVTQTLFSTTLIADVLPDIWEMNPLEGKRRLEELRQLTRGALAEMRTLLVELRPNALVEVPLQTLLRQLTDAMIGRSRIDIQLNLEGECNLPADVKVGFYRITQEALNNVVKHAKARQVVLTLRMGEEVRLTVSDDGAGFDPSGVTADHLGLKIMRERAEAMGAKLSVYSEPDEGTQISVVWKYRIPIPG